MLLTSFRVLGWSSNNKSRERGCLLQGGVLSPKVLEAGAVPLHHFSKQLFVETLRFTG